MPIFNNPLRLPAVPGVAALPVFDRRAVDTGCAGCPRVTDSDYLIERGLCVPGVAYELGDSHAALE